MYLPAPVPRRPLCELKLLVFAEGAAAQDEAGGKGLDLDCGTSASQCELIVTGLGRHPVQPAGAGGPNPGGGPVGSNREEAAAAVVATTTELRSREGVIVRGAEPRMI